MNQQRLTRFGLLIALVAVAIAAFSVPAVAAGPPGSVSLQYGEEKLGEEGGVNYVELLGYANPNGAATTVYFEYKAGEGSFETSSSRLIESAQPLPVTYTGLTTGLVYHMRLRATNSYGTTYSKEVTYRPQWVLPLHPFASSEVRSEGTLKYEYKAGGVNVKWECGEYGYGEIHSQSGAASNPPLNLSNCSYYVNGALTCKTAEPPPVINLTGGFSPSFFGGKQSYSFVVCPGQEAKQAITISATPMSVKVPTSESYVNLPMTLTTTGTFGGQNATVTVTGSWHLTGELSGSKFLWEYL